MWLVEWLLGHPDWRTRDRTTRALALLNVFVCVDHLLPVRSNDPEVAWRAAAVYRVVPDWSELPEGRNKRVLEAIGGTYRLDETSAGWNEWVRATLREWTWYDSLHSDAWPDPRTKYIR